MRSTSRLQPHSKGSGSPRRSPNLHLPGLPRFHPANYPTVPSALSTTSASASASGSGASSNANSPPSNLGSPQAPPVLTSTAPRPQYHSRQYSDAQRQLYAHQRELMSLNQYAGMSSRSPQASSPSGNAMRSSPLSPRSPGSPRLHPLGSPGPVTPLELEEHTPHRDGYIFAGTGWDTKQLNEHAKEQILETFIQRETAEAAARASNGPSPNMATHAQHARAYPYSGPMGVRRGDPTSHRSALSR